jgi:hypothetical protein
VARFEASAQARHIPLTVIRDTYAGGREDYAARLVLVRPDQYVVWTGDAAPGDADDVMRKVVGRAS